MIVAFRDQHADELGRQNLGQQPVVGNSCRYVVAPVLDYTVGGHYDAAAQLLASVHHGLQQFGPGAGDAPRKEHVVQYQQVQIGNVPITVERCRMTAPLS